MVIAVTNTRSLDYQACRYGKSKLIFRGPKKDTSGDYVVVLGGTETYGRFVVRPFCTLAEDALGVPVLNLGCPNAGIDAFLYDNDLIALAKGARVTVIQVPGAQNMSNRFYRVHPRRNDRFLGPSDTLKQLYPTIDFTDFSFVRHMLSTLLMTSTESFGALREELRRAWRARMQLMLQTIDGPVLLLWLREPVSEGLGAEPLFVGADMVFDAGQGADAVVEVTVQRAGDDLEGMIFGPLEANIASQMLGLQEHQAIAAALTPILAQHLA